MTIVTDAIIKGRVLSRTTTVNVPDNDAIIYVDEIIQDICAKLKNIDENYVYKIATIDLVAYQHEYDLPIDFEHSLFMEHKRSSPTYDDWVTGTEYVAGDKVVDSGLAYVAKVDHTAGATFAGDSTSWTQIFENYKKISLRKLEFKSMGDYQQQSPLEPVGFLGLEKIFVYPRLENSVTQGIRIFYIPQLDEVTLSTADTDIYIPRRFHKFIRRGLKHKFLYHIGKDELAQAEEASYRAKLDLQIDELRERDFSSVVERLPYLSHLSH